MAHATGLEQSLRPHRARRGDVAPFSNGSAGIEDENKYRVIASGGDTVAFRVVPTSGEDNVYRVRVDDAQTAEPRVAIVSPPAPSGSVQVCADSDVDLEADVSFPFFSSVTAPPSEIIWRNGTTVLGSGPGITRSFVEGTHDIEVRVFDDTAYSDSIELDTRTCTDFPPTVTITSPTDAQLSDSLNWQYDGFDDDKGMWYKDVVLRGTATDPEDGTLSGSSLIWKTDRTDLQDEVLGTGNEVEVRLYSNDCFGVAHNIRLEATDSAGNPATPDAIEIVIWTLC